MKKIKMVKVIDKTSLRNGGIYEVLEEFDNGYFIHVGRGCREFVLKIHTKLIIEL